MNARRAMRLAALALAAAAGCRVSAPPAGSAAPAPVGDVDALASDDMPGEESDPVRPDPTDPIPDVEMTTQNGEHVRFYSDCVRGKIVLVNVMYTRCDGSCPGNTANLAKVQEILGDRVGRDVFFVSISLDPANDRPTDLAAYARSYGAKPGWRFLVGDAADTERLRRRLGFWDPDPAVDRDKSQHAGLVLFGNEPRGWWGALPATSNPERIAAAVRRIAGPVPSERGTTTSR